MKKLSAGCLTLLIVPIILRVLYTLWDPGYARMPEVKNLDLNQAISILKEYGFEYSVQPTDGGKKNWVFAQAPAAGEFFRKDRKVVLFIQTGFVSVTLPASNGGVLESSRSGNQVLNRDLVLPAGTVFTIKLKELIVATEASSSQTLDALLAKPVFLNGEILCYEGAGALLRYEVKTSPDTVEAELRLLEVVLVNGAVLEVHSDALARKASTSIAAAAGGAVGGAAVGAIIGTLIGSLFGAPEVGMLIGGAGGVPTGAAVAAELTKNLTIEAGTSVEFTLHDDAIVHFPAR